MPRNPFHHLYVGERLSAREFTDIFSTELVQHAMPLFEPGHVVLTGANGMGKTMLFKLLDPEVRLEYERAGKSFPVPEAAGRFIAAGINVNTARCNDFGNRRVADGDQIQELMFGDFLNYFICIDMLRSVEVLAADPNVATHLGIVWTDEIRAGLAESLSADPVWEGYLSEAVGYDDVRTRMEGRLLRYRRYMNGNDRELDAEVARTKTGAGEPIRKMVLHLRAAGALAADLPFYILIDQYEELASISSVDDQRAGARRADYRSVVNKMINSRDPAVSYRIGTRGYGWRNHLRIFGTDMRLEEERLFKKVELEARLRRAENAKSVFPAFARDVFRRRVQHAAGREGNLDPRLTIADVFGRSMSPADEARILAGKETAARRGVVMSDEGWPEALIESLREIAISDPLSAKLGEAWMRQKGAPVDLRPDDLPWDRKPYWKKERTEVAILQIAGQRRQRAILSGEEDIVALSGGNILMFLSICQLIWETASQTSTTESGEPELPIGWDAQTVGIFRAGRSWLNRISSEYGRSHDRFRLVEKIGERCADLLLSDRKMSNPGQNGVSILLDELRANPEIHEFLIEAVDYGNLVMTEHANRSDRRRRLKFYLNPLYCPIFRIPYQRTKEPLYLPMTGLREWLAEAGIIDEPVRKPRERVIPGDVPTLFDLMDPKA